MSDYIIRATAADGAVRAFAATTREMTETARKIHGTSPVATAALGRLLTGGAMMGTMMKNDSDVLTLQINCGGPIGGLTVTADAKGRVKGYVANPNVDLPPNSVGKLDVGSALGVGVLSVIRDMGMKDPYVGQVELKTGEIGDDLTYYFASSEQVPSAVGLGVLVDKDLSVRRAGGFIIQLMPNADETVISRLEDKLQGTASVTSMLDNGYTPELILEHLLGDFDLVINDKLPTDFYCNCSRERVERVLLSVGEKELKSMIDDGEDVELCCHFCGKKYKFGIDEVKELLRVSKTR